ncbi:MAG: ClbS/DfsB family four-helix bundle protein [Anaerolineae bacterium]|nr:ClbS/DfsB family four-helix bundle protein [Anaerolineae bacterium]
MSDMPESDITIPELLSRIDASWTRLQDYLASVSPERLTGPKDAAGWSVADHLYHIAAWSDSVLALLNGQSRAAAVGLDEATWANGVEVINAALQVHSREMPLDAVLAALNQSHAQMVAKLKTLTDADLQRPYRYFLPNSDREQPVINWIAGDSYEHYDEHLPWIRAIVEG